MAYLPHLNVPYFIAHKLRAKGNSCVICGERKEQPRPTLCEATDINRNNTPAGTWLTCARCRRSMRLINRTFDDAVEQSEHLVTEMFRRWLTYDEVISFGEPPWRVVLPLRVFALLSEARRSFLFGNHFGAIALVSAAVEVAINEDTRKTDAKWLMLNIKSLQRAMNWGCPIALLLQPDELVNTTIRPSPNPRFIHQRNKCAHGEGSETLPTGWFAPTVLERTAVEQIEKSQSFIMAWAKSPGNPLYEHKKYVNTPGDEFETRKISIRVPAFSLRIGFHIPWIQGNWD